MSAYSGALNPAISAEFSSLDQGESVLAEYVWIDGTGQGTRSKCRVLDKAPKAVDDLPVWNFDGSSTGQAPGEDSEVLLKPAAIFRDPFRKGNNIMVLCENHKPLDGGKMEPLSHMTSEFGITGNNTRAKAVEVFENPAVKSQECWFGLEQEYTLFESDKTTPLGWPRGGFPAPQGQYYCSAGVENAFGRDIADAHLKACVYAGIKISGTNAEVMPGQWEFQIGPCLGIEEGDHLWMARYIMYRVCERFNVHVTFHPKPITGDWNGAGCHANFSTKDMRDPKCSYKYTPKDGPYAGKELSGGFARVIEACIKLGTKHDEHIKVYGPHNEMRLTGLHETASVNDYSYGVANRGASIRIPRETEGKGYGYMEDRRPASNCDPYVVTWMVASTILL